MIAYRYLTSIHEFLKDGCFGKTGLKDINALAKALTSRAPHVDIHRIEEAAEGSYLLFALEDERIVGMGALVPIVTLIGHTGRIEDVVVLKKYRGDYHGERIDETIMMMLHDKARVLGLTRIRLTSNPSRKAANAFFKRLGYREIDTNVFEFDL